MGTSYDGDGRIAVLELLLVVMAVTLFDLAAVRWGSDSRRGT